MTSIHVKLRERLDMFPQGFPKTASGVELEILEDLFSEEDAETALALRPFPEPVSVIGERLQRDEAKLGKHLYDMSKRGLILRNKESETSIYYFLAPWIIGIWEFQLKNLTPDNIERYEKYFEEGIVPANQKKSIGGFRVIPIEKEISDGSQIEPFEKVSEIIASSSRFAVAECICRKEARMMDKGCDKILESCMMFDMAADYYIDNGLGREITRTEANQVLLKAEESSQVHCSSNHKGQKIFICNCCGCCCKALAAITKYDNPGLIAKSNYYAVIDTETCEGCEACLDRCQVQAIHMADDIAVITTDKCIGCGLCISTCPTESMGMARKEPHALSHIYADDIDLSLARSKDTGKAFPFE
jgi:H+/Na+-translocating ferredoxin:NAD+ oxidoreductase subunit B